MSLSIRRGARRQAGMTLIEVLVSLTILAFGLMGMTALQNEALKFNQTAFLDSQAQFLLTDMAERIRANSGNNGYALLYAEDPPNAAVDCASASCNSTQMAAWDLNQWRDRVENSAFLPQGESQILFDNTTRTFVLSIRYDWSRLGATDLNGSKRSVSFTTRIGG